MRRSTLTTAITALATLFIASCSRPNAPLVPTPIPEVTISQAIERVVTDYDEYPGKVAALQTVEVRPRVDGYLTKILFKDGSEVKQGQQLFEIDPRPYKAQVDLDKARVDDAQAKLKLAEVEYSRYKNLRSRNVASQEDLDKSQAARDQASAEIAMARANLEKSRLDLDWTHVNAPISGRISRRDVDLGNLIDGTSANATKLTTIVTEDPIYVNFDVDERKVQNYRKEASEGRGQVKKVSEIESYKMPVYVGLTSEKGFPHEGIVDFVDNQVNKSTGTVRARARLANTDRRLQAGYFARVRIRGGDPYKALLVPERAIGSQQDQRYVLVVGADNKVEFHRVELGTLQDDGLRVLTSGLKPGEWIITEGLQRARPGDPVTPEKKPLGTQSG